MVMLTTMTMTNDDGGDDEHEREREHEYGSYNYDSDKDFIFSLVPTTALERFTHISHLRTSTSSRLKWTPIPLDEVNGRLLGYNISVYDYRRKKNTYRLAPPNASAMELDELRPYTSYRVGIRAYTRVGVATVANVVGFQTLQSGKLCACHFVCHCVCVCVCVCVCLVLFVKLMAGKLLKCLMYQRKVDVDMLNAVVCFER